MLFSLSAITAKPLSCIRSRPVRDFKLPVDRKDYRFLPIMPDYNSFFKFYIENSFLSTKIVLL
jgi:hypothetical protein